MFDIKPEDFPFLILFVFAVLHLIYFLVYYGRYSRLNQKLAKMDRLEKSGLIDQKRIDLTRTNTHNLIKKMRRICYMPSGIILVIHWSFNLYYFGKSFEIIHLLEPIYIALAGSILILIGNYTRGAQIFDPNRKFFNRGRF